MLRIFIIFMTTLLMTSCIHETRYKEFEPRRGVNGLYEMPKVAVVPAFDISYSGVNWNVAYELTQNIREKILCDKNLFLLKEEEMFNRVMKTGHMAFDDTACSIWRLFGKAYFVVLVELFQHDVIPTGREELPILQRTQCDRCSSELLMKARLTILDVREFKPCIILEEIVNCNQLIPKDYEFWNYARTPWNSPFTECYKETPYCAAHKRLAEVIVNRVQNVVWMAH